MSAIKTLLATLALALASLSAHADVVYRFTGSADSGPLVGSTYEGELGFDDVAADFDGWATLTHFQFQGFGTVLGLGDADPALGAPVAWFAGGQFLGVDFQAVFDGQRPWVALVAGFFDPSEAYLAYGDADGLNGFGSLSFERVTAEVPEPTTAALMLLGLAGLASRRRR